MTHQKCSFAPRMVAVAACVVTTLSMAQDAKNTSSERGFKTEKTESTERYTVRAVTLVNGLVNPWGMAFLPDGRMLVNEVTDLAGKGDHHDE